MDVTTANREFRDSLESVETCLMTPRVSGELDGWIANLKHAMDTFGAALLQQISEGHCAAFQQITSQDSELHSRVEQLQRNDLQSRELYDALQNRLAILEKSTPRVEPDEGRLEMEVVKFCESGLAFVQHVRKQEVAIDTWFQEAFQRDRGISG